MADKPRRVGIRKSVSGLRSTVKTLRKPGGTRTSLENAYDWMHGGKERFDKAAREGRWDYKRGRMKE